MLNTMCSEKIDSNQYADYKCISCACDKCGTQNFKAALLSQNQHLD